MHLQGVLPPPTAAALSKLVSLFALSTIAREAGDFLEDGYLSRQQARLPSPPLSHPVAFSFGPFHLSGFAACQHGPAVKLSENNVDCKSLCSFSRVRIAFTPTLWACAQHMLKMCC